MRHTTLRVVNWPEVWTSATRLRRSDAYDRCVAASQTPTPHTVLALNIRGARFTGTGHDAARAQGRYKGCCASTAPACGLSLNLVVDCHRQDAQPSAQSSAATSSVISGHQLSHQISHQRTNRAQSRQPTALVARSLAPRSGENHGSDHYQNICKCAP